MSEANPETGQTINSVIREINTEFTDELESIIETNPHDHLDMSGSRALWKHVLAVYTVRTVTDPDNPMEVAMMTEEKAGMQCNPTAPAPSLSRQPHPRCEHSISYMPMSIQEENS